jgi:transposase InsO family protein
MDLKADFIRRLNSGERMADLCREYGIARKTGYKLKKRHDERGTPGLSELSRAPLHIPHKTPPEVAELLVAARKQHPTWGPKKIKDVLERRLGRRLPTKSTIGNLLVAHGLVERRKTRLRHKWTSTTMRQASGPNEIWCVDYKGQFRLGDKSYCYPLTITDQFSRYILGCDGMAAISDEAAREVFEEVFRARGLPEAMRSDNGVPFASTGLAGLTKLSAYWMRLGIVLERIRPGNPQQNGRHERMHRTLKRETARPPRHNLLQQQQLFDEWVEEFNIERPHEALDMKRPAEVYASSPRPYPDALPELKYPTHDDVITVSQLGTIYIAGLGQTHLTAALACQEVGIREESDGRWLVTFAELDLGHVETNKRFTPITSIPPEAN